MMSPSSAHREVSWLKCGTVFPVTQAPRPALAHKLRGAAAQRVFLGLFRVVLGFVVLAGITSSLRQVEAAPPRGEDDGDTAADVKGAQAPAASAVWYDGRGGIFVAAAGLVSWRFGDAAWETAPSELKEPVGVAGWRGGARLIVAFVDATGFVVRRQGDVLDRHRLALQAGEVVIDIAVTGAGDVAVVTSTGVWNWTEDRLEYKGWPSDGKIDPIGAAGSAGRQFFVVGKGGVAVRWQGRKGRRLVTSGAGESYSTASWRAAWYSQDTGTLWVRAGEDGLLRVATEGSGAVEAIRIPRLSPGSSRVASRVHLDGHIGLSGDEVVFTMGRAVFRMRDKQITWIADLEADIDDIAVARDLNEVLVTSAGILHRLPLREDVRVAPLSGGPPLDQHERERLKHARWRQRVISKSSVNARLLIPSMHIGLGGHGHVGSARAAFALDAGVGLQIAPNRGRMAPTWWLWPRLDYVFDAHPARGYHGATAGLGIGVGTDLIVGYYTPRAWVGAGREGPFGGYRHALGVHAIWGVLGLEAMHGVRTGPDGARHEVGAMVTLNIAPLIWLGAVLGRDQ